MKLSTYSSVSAFIAHFRALKAARNRTVEEESLFVEMSEAVDSLHQPERAALESDEQISTARRRRERAEINLRRQLLARGILSG
jgi:hypothetical protein